MKKLAVVALLSCLGYSLFAQQTDTLQKMVSPIFGWTMMVPAAFKAVSNEEVKRINQKGKVAIEATIDQEIPLNTQPIFNYRKDVMHYMEANYQPYDVKIDGAYLETNRSIYDVVYQTFEREMPEAKIDTAQEFETVNGLQFSRFKVAIRLNANFQIKMYMYNRLFGKKDLTVTFMFVDPKIGDEMLRYWRLSTFKIRR